MSIEPLKVKLPNSPTSVAKSEDRVRVSSRVVWFSWASWQAGKRAFFRCFDNGKKEEKWGGETGAAAAA